MTHANRDMSAIGRQIVFVLRVGLFTSAMVLFVGLNMVLAELPWGTEAIGVGLMLLIAVPVTRICASLLDAIKRRDHVLIAATVVVLTVMALTLVLSLRGL